MAMHAAMMKGERRQARMQGELQDYGFGMLGCAGLASKAGKNSRMR